ncbi:TRAP transporter small permease subunit [Chloroflexota bacterium]
MPHLTRVLRVIDLISEWSGKIVSFLIPVLIAVICLEVTARYVFNAPTLWAHEVSLFSFGTAVVMGGAFVLWHDGHIRVDIIYNRWSPRAKAIADMGSLIILFFFLSFMLFYSSKVALLSIRIRELNFGDWQPIIYPIKTMIPLGALLFFLGGLARFIRSFIVALKGHLI